MNKRGRASLNFECYTNLNETKCINGNEQQEKMKQVQFFAHLVAISDLGQFTKF